MSQEDYEGLYKDYEIAYRKFDEGLITEEQLKEFLSELWDRKYPWDDPDIDEVHEIRREIRRQKQEKNVLLEK